MALDNSVFKKPPVEFTYQLTINTEGLERCGKSNFAMTAPSPIGIIMLDRNTENVAIKRQREGKVIKYADFTDPNPKTNPQLAQFVLPGRAKPGAVMKAEVKAPKDFYLKRWDAICEAYFSLVDDPTIKTIVIDTGTQMWEDIRLARFGKLTQVAPRDYGIVNQEMREMIMAARCNLIVTHKLGKKYNGNDWDGRSYEGKGWSDVAYACQITMRHTIEMIPMEDNPKQKRAQFMATVIDCNQDPGLRGVQLTDDDCNFAMLASLVYPDAPSSLWE